MSLVLDASAAVDALLPTMRQARTLTMLESHDLYAPQLIDLEVTSAVARLERANDITSAESAQAIADWAQLPLTRVDSDVLLEEVWRLRHAVRISDGFYLAAAKALQVSLLTADARLSRAAVTDVSITLVR